MEECQGISQDPPFDNAVAIQSYPTLSTGFVESGGNGYSSGMAGTLAVSECYKCRLGLGLEDMAKKKEDILSGKKVMIIGIPTLLLASAGFAYYHYVGCNNGACAIASSPVLSTVFGAIIGASVGFTLSDGKKKDANL